MNSTAHNLPPTDTPETHSAPLNEVTITQSDYDAFLAQKSWAEALERFDATMPSNEVSSAVMNASLGTVEEIDRFLAEHQDLSPQAQHLLGIDRALRAKREEEKTPKEQEETITLTGTQAEEYQDYQLYMKNIDTFTRIKASKAKTYIMQLSFQGNGEGLAAYQREHWAELTPTEAEYIEEAMLVIRKGIDGMKYGWASIKSKPETKD